MAKRLALVWALSLLTAVYAFAGDIADDGVVVYPRGAEDAAAAVGPVAGDDIIDDPAGAI